jgi:neutral ceramidase
VHSRRFLRALGPVLLLAVGGAYALASGNWCGVWEPGAPAVVFAARAADVPLRAGAARVPLEPPFPVVAAGYGPPRPELSVASPPLHARALVLSAGELKVGLVALDLLTISPGLEQALREAPTGLDEVWVVATHSHSSFGGYDHRLVSQLAGTGRYRPAALGAAVRGATEALRLALAAQEPVVPELRTGDLPGAAIPRTGAEVASGLVRLVLRGGEGTVGELWVVAAHPTLVPRPPPALSPDYPGLLDAPEGPVILVLQGAAGNARAEVEAGEGTAPERFAGRLRQAATAATPVEGVGADAARSPLSTARVRFNLPRPDASRLAPWFARAAGDNLLCRSSARQAEVAVLRVGALRLLAVPGEPSFAAGQRLAAQADGLHVVGLAGAYLGYVEPAEVVRGGHGESRRQYFRPELLEVMAEAAAVAARAVE